MSLLAPRQHPSSIRLRGAPVITQTLRCLTLPLNMHAPSPLPCGNALHHPLLRQHSSPPLLVWSLRGLMLLITLPLPASFVKLCIWKLLLSPCVLYPGEFQMNNISFITKTRSMPWQKVHLHIQNLYLDLCLLLLACSLLSPNYSSFFRMALESLSTSGVCLMVMQVLEPPSWPPSFSTASSGTV